MVGGGQSINSIFECLEIEGDDEEKSEDDEEKSEDDEGRFEDDEWRSEDDVGGCLKINWGAKSIGRWGDRDD